MKVSEVRVEYGKRKTVGCSVRVKGSVRLSVVRVVLRLYAMVHLGCLGQLLRRAAAIASPWANLLLFA